MNITKRKVIALLRVSTDKQDVARQRTDVGRVIASHGLEVIRTEEVGGVSGRHVQQDPQFQGIFRDLKRADVAGVAISALDRLFRPDFYSDFAILDHFRANQKVIFSSKEGILDPSTDAGFMMSLMGGAQAGMEWREMRRRTMQGKEEKRLKGRHVNGRSTLPRGVAFDKETGQWSYQEPDCSRVVEMFRLLLAGDSAHTIALKVGGGWSHNGVRTALRNRIWAFGERVYPPDSHREEPLVVKVIDKPLVPVTIWEAAQRELDNRKTAWRKTRKPPRFLVSSLLRCICGRACYLRAATRWSSHRDAYYCASRFPSGHGCGARTVWRESVDAAVEQLAAISFCDTRVLNAIIDGISGGEPESTAGAKAARDVERLAAKRARIVEMRADGLISREECGKRLGVVDQELAAARSMAALPDVQAIDVKAITAALVRTFARFGKMAFPEKQGLLRRACREITLDSITSTIPTITFKGGFLGELLDEANLSRHSPAAYKPDAQPSPPTPSSSPTAACNSESRASTTTEAPPPASHPARTQAANAQTPPLRSTHTPPLPVVSRNLEKVLIARDQQLPRPKGSGNVTH